MMMVNLPILLIKEFIQGNFFGGIFSPTHKIPPQSGIFSQKGIFWGKNSPKNSLFPFWPGGIYPISPRPKKEFFPLVDLDILKLLSKVELFVEEFLIFLYLLRIFDLLCQRNELKLRRMRLQISRIVLVMLQQKTSSISRVYIGRLTKY